MREDTLPAIALERAAPEPPWHGWRRDGTMSLQIRCHRGPTGSRASNRSRRIIGRTRMLRRVLTASLLVLLLAALFVSGRRLFTTADDPRLLEQRAKFVLDAEPDGGQPVLDVREAYKKPDQVVIIGKIGGV